MVYVTLIGLIVLVVLMLILLGMFAFADDTEFGALEDSVNDSSVLPGNRITYLSVVSVIIFVLTSAIILLWGTL